MKQAFGIMTRAGWKYLPVSTLKNLKRERKYCTMLNLVQTQIRTQQKIVYFMLTVFFVLTTFSPGCSYYWKSGTCYFDWNDRWKHERFWIVDTEFLAPFCCAGANSLQHRPVDITVQWKEGVTSDGKISLLVLVPSGCLYKDCVCASDCGQVDRSFAPWLDKAMSWCYDPKTHRLYFLFFSF